MSKYQLIPFPYFSHSLRRWGIEFFFYTCESCYHALSPSLKVLDNSIETILIDYEEQDEKSPSYVWREATCDVVGCSNKAYIEIHQKYIKGNYKYL